LSVYAQFNWFNMYKPEFKYDDLVFSMKFFTENRGAIRYFMPNMGMAKKISPQFTIMLAYILQTGTIFQDEFILPHSSIDFIISNLRNTKHICYGQPERTIKLAEDIIAPFIRVTARNDEESFVEMEEGYEIIYGKFSGYCLSDNVLHKLPKDFPIALHRLINSKSGVVKTMLIPEHLRAGYIPGVTFPLIKRTESDKEKIEEININPDIKIFAGKSNNGDLYLKPVMKYGNYLDVIIGGEYVKGDHYLTEKEGCKYKIKRDEIKEILLANEFNKHPFCFTYDNDRYFCRNIESIKQLIKEILPELCKKYNVIIEEGIDKLTFKKSNISTKINAQHNNENNFFDFDIDFYCEKIGINLKDLMEMLSKEKGFLFYGSSYIEIENRTDTEKLLTIINDMKREKAQNREGAEFSLSPAEALGLKSILSGIESVEYNGDSVYRQFLDEATQGSLLDGIKIEDNLIKILRNYQVNGVKWMAFLKKYGLSGILADDMGLGKTLQVLTLLKTVKGQGVSLIICPKTLIYNWNEEIRKFTSDLKVLIPEGDTSKRKEQIKELHEYDAVITSYSLVRNDIEYYKEHSFKYCVLDEAQYIKNPDAESTKKVKLIKAVNRLALTGTPIENSLLELWSVFDFLMPGFLGGRKKFNEVFGNSPELLRQRIKPFVLRRTKKETLSELPEKIEQVQHVVMNKKQFEMYTQVLKSVRKDMFENVESKGFGRSRIAILAALTKLRQICNHPGLVDEKYLNNDEISAKLELFEELINNCVESGSKVLVFSQFTKMLGILARVLKNNNIMFSYLDGSSENRGEIIDKFNEDNNIRVFLISIKAGGYGLNLTSADTVILYDPWWNPMVENQAVDRAHRMGQKKSVNVYRLITEGSIEEKIQALKEKKQALFDAVISDNSEYVGELSWEDIRQMLM